MVRCSDAAKALHPEQNVKNKQNDRHLLASFHSEWMESSIKAEMGGVGLEKGTEPNGSVPDARCISRKSSGYRYE